VKSCYYAANCPSDVLDKHVSKVIFEHVIWKKKLEERSMSFRDGCQTCTKESCKVF
jgi:hypothetical protein